MNFTLPNRIDTHLDCGIFRAVIQASTTPVFIKDRSGVYKTCNLAFCEFLGLEHSEIIGRTVDDIASEELASLYKAADEALYADGNPQRYRAEIMARAGLRIVEFSKEVIFNSQGEAIGLVGFIHDITELVASHKKLIEKELLWQEGQAMAKLSSWSLNHANLVVETGVDGLRNAGLMIPDTALPWHDFLAHIHEGDQPMLHDAIFGATPANARFNIRARSSQQFGLPRYFRIIGKTSFSENGEPIVSVGAIQDVTEQVGSDQALDRAMRQTIVAMAGTLETRDPYTGEHQTRVSELCDLIGQQLDLSENQLEGLVLAATVHDIGKIKLPAEILSKPSRLSAIEYELIKTHAEAGYDILKDIDFPWPIAEIVYQHHERLDGSGYPRGLENGDIFIEAKILAVADTIESMASHRPYRPALGVPMALEVIEEGRGRIFDASVVDAALSIIEHKFWPVEELDHTPKVVSTSLQQSTLTTGRP